MVIYLDDMLFLHQQKEGQLETCGLALDLLKNLGDLVNGRSISSTKHQLPGAHDRLPRN